MNKNESVLCMVVFLSLLAAPISCTRSYETQIVFVPDTSESSLRSAASKGNMDELDTSEERYRKAIEKLENPTFRLRMQ